MEEIEVLELYELNYSDLVLLSSLSASECDVSIEDQPRLESIRRAILETLGNNGPGLLSITGVPKASTLRRNLLPLARDLALLDNERRKRLLKVHNLGSDVPLKNPDRSVSSFAMQLKYADALEFAPGKPNRGSQLHLECEETHLDDDKVGKFDNLGNAFKELGYCMMELGLCLARICDEFIGGKELERSLLESGTAKGRLIHYHSFLDNLLIKESSRKKPNPKENIEKFLRNRQKQFQWQKIARNDDLWQQWHYDYGIFTVLTAPMFSLPSFLSENTDTICNQECPFPNGYSYLQIFDPNKNKVVMVKTSPGNFIVQVGESADILSKGKLRSTLHCVSRPLNIDNISRETFVVFLQPAWSKTFTISDYVLEHLKSVNQREFKQDNHKIIPPLSSRLRDGMTFAEFSRETTKQYYGGSGLQSNR